MEEKIPVEPGEKAAVREDVNEEDHAALLRSVADARKRSDFVLVNVHTHEDENENRHGVNPPQFLIDYAHAAIDAEGARYQVVPIDIDMRRENPVHRGLPEIMKPELAKEFARTLTKLSKKSGTKFEYQKDSNTFVMK